MHAGLKECCKYFLEFEHHHRHVNVYHSFIFQATSWSRLKITFPMFASLCCYLSLRPSFLDLLTTFGYRTSDTDNYYNSIWRGHSYTGDSETTQPTYDVIQTQVSSIDTCYNIRYVDMHGKQKPDPWSFRNLAVHQSFNKTSSRSDWVFVNLPSPVLAHIELLANKSEGHQLCPLAPHLYILAYCVSKWRWYLNYIDVMCEEIVSFSSVASLHPPDIVRVEVDSGHFLQIKQIDRSRLFTRLCH